MSLIIIHNESDNKDAGTGCDDLLAGSGAVLPHGSKTTKGELNTTKEEKNTTKVELKTTRGLVSGFAVRSVREFLLKPLPCLHLQIQFFRKR